MRPPLVLQVRSARGAEAPRLLRGLAFSVFVFPASMVLSPLGAVGTVAMMMAGLIALLWAVSRAWDLWTPPHAGYPGLSGLTFLLLTSSASYAAMFIGETGGSTESTRLAADRWMILLTCSCGVALYIGEQLRTKSEVMSFVRALLSGALFCCAIAAVQFFVRVNPVDWIQQAMPGFTLNSDSTPFQVRGDLVRVAGTTFHSIELAVVAAMLLPLAIWRALFDSFGRRWIHWSTAAMLVFAMAATVSRTGVLAFSVAALIFVPTLPKGVRSSALVAIPATLVILFVIMPGLMGTLSTSLVAGNNDPSIRTRTGNISRVEALIREHPMFGLGPGNYVPESALQILDNQYFGAAVTLGLGGMLATLAYFIAPLAATAWVAFKTADAELRGLAGAVAAGSGVAAASSATFDSLSFPVFALVFPMLLGLGGATWAMYKGAMRERGAGAPLGAPDAFTNVTGK